MQVLMIERDTGYSINYTRLTRLVFNVSMKGEILLPNLCYLDMTMLNETKFNFTSSYTNLFLCA